ncbi:DUF6090 family protein [Yeosuana sp. MJ-SS3]|uniref:DUF6090 family protein n=1 Tax=Gilvirhabdus luticola TaxID=3079858 RepID=A0ABU3U9Z5_9FLAO|nr:DUF6090 family protein [Yeosuana sp. MJ-SS3]MDU8887229.1 DUF6090 family protein [Yeosuana sp. MJ-SS3]
MENKTGKYLKYAIGEIILVVIGILIALQINNWNEQRKSNDLYYSYLLRLKEDFTSIYNSTTDALEIEERLLNLGKLVLDFNLNNKEDVNPLELAIGIDYTAGRQFYNKSSQTWKDLVSTGNLKLIENKQLRNDIGAYNNLANQRDFQIEEWFRFKEQYRDLTRHILKPEERLLIPDNWPNTNVSESGFDDLRSIFNSSLDEIKFKLQEIPELNGVLSDVIITREITTHMMHGELKILNGILDIIEFEISKFK